MNDLISREKALEALCGKERTGRGKSAYCPDCGAKMRKNDDIIFGQDSFEI